MISNVTAALIEYVESKLVVALIDAGRCPDAAQEVARILRPTVANLLTDPVVRQATVRADG